MSQQTTDRSFDDLARALAEGSISRRRALKLFAGTAIAALIPSRALAQQKAIICHKPGTPDEKTIEVSESAVASHQRHGDSLGACGESTTTTSTSTSTSSTTSTTSTSTSTTTPTTSTSTSTTSTSTTLRPRGNGFQCQCANTQLFEVCSSMPCTDDSILQVCGSVCEQNGSGFANGTCRVDDCLL